MASRSRLPIMASALFLLLGAVAYFLPTFVPYMAINGFNIVEYKDIIAIAFGALAAVFLLVSALSGRSKNDEDEASDDTEGYDEAVVVEFAEEAPAAEAITENYYQDAYDVPAFDNTVDEYAQEAPVKLTSAEKRALKAAAKAEKKRLKQEAKFAKKAEKEAAKAAKAAEKAAAKGAVVESDILDAETGTDWYKDEDFLTQTVTETPVDEDAAESTDDEASVDETVEASEVTDENWTEAAYTDPDFTVPFADETIETPAEAEVEEEQVEVAAEDSADAEPAVENADVAALKSQVAALEAALNDQAQNTQYALLELSEATRSNSTARLEWLKDMVEKNDFGDDVILRMIDMLIRQAKADEDTVQSALSATDLRK